MCLAIPGKIVDATEGDPLSRMGKVDFGGVIKEVNLAYVPEANRGDYVIVHAGFAISQLQEEEAQNVFQYLREIEEVKESFENENSE